MSTESNEQYRAGFEAWMRKEYGSTVALFIERKKQSGRYQEDRTEDKWQSWIASKSESSEQAKAGFEEWARDNGHPIRFNADGSYAGMNSYRFEGYAGARREAGTELSAEPVAWQWRHQVGKNKDRAGAWALISKGRYDRRHDYPHSEFRELFARPVSDQSGALTNGAKDRYTAYVKKCEAGAILPCSEESFRDDAKDAAMWRELLACVVAEMPHARNRNDGNAPGHAHSKRGIWDSDNGVKAGQVCAWCKVWNSAVAAIEAHTKEKKR